MLLAVDNSALRSNTTPQSGPSQVAASRATINRVSLRDPLQHALRELLPKGWSFRLGPEAGTHEFDGALDVIPPHGRASRFVVNVKARVEPRDIDSLERLSARLPAGARLLIVASHLSPRSRQLLKERNISFVDRTGNVLLSSDSLLVDHAGPDKRKKSDVEQRPRASLRGPITGRVIRFLCDISSPLKVRQIATETKVHPGNVSRILDFLERERLVQRSSAGSVSSVDWGALIARWSVDLRKDRRAESFLEPRGLEAITKRLPGWNLPYAVTGSFASAELAPVAQPVTIDIYVRDIDEAREALSLRRSERIGNVRLIEAFDHVVFERTLTRADMILASPSQIGADILTLPNRSPDEYSELVEWMQRHESVWRR